ncbi:Alpha/Beta hydrolase protein [Mycena belliarum]|uniref:Alpha/Beta hydrolase protein n=1 Tax=Mycena belliarum TaxID=1033014 RepID=A0AAD6TW77_9AGAR|nr:Alpha/Beta hydrolase protein [Mycena belliae]
MLTLHFTLLWPVLALASAPLVTLPYGVFRGAADANLPTFRGVPFARPVKRFEPPRAPKLLHGVQNATDFGAACQDSAGYRIDVRGVVERSMVNDELAVIILSLNTSSLFLAFGFLVGNEAGAAGWVQKHICAFGENPARVVIGGPSAGAISVATLLMSNQRFNPTDLFHGAFMLSGSPLTTGTVAEGQADYDGLAAANNCTHAADTLAITVVWKLELERLSHVSNF